MHEHNHIKTATLEANTDANGNCNMAVAQVTLGRPEVKSRSPMT